MEGNNINPNLYQYMLSDLIKDAVDILSKEGDKPVMVDILTENQSNVFKLTPDLTLINDKILVTVDLNHLTVGDFKKSIK